MTSRPLLHRDPAVKLLWAGASARAVKEQSACHIPQLVDSTPAQLPHPVAYHQGSHGPSLADCTVRGTFHSRHGLLTTIQASVLRDIGQVIVATHADAEESLLHMNAGYNVLHNASQQVLCDSCFSLKHGQAAGVADSGVGMHHSNCSTAHG